MKCGDKNTLSNQVQLHISDEKQAIKQTALLQSALCALINLIQWLQSAPKKCVSSVRLPMTTVLDEILHLQEPHTCAERKRLNSHRSPWAHSGCKNHWTRRQRASSLCQNGGVKVFRPSPNVCRAKMMKWFSRSFVIWCFLWCERLKGENRELRCEKMHFSPKIFCRITNPDWCISKSTGWVAENC